MACASSCVVAPVPAALPRIRCVHDVSGSLPVPVDDGAADYLLGSKVPSLSLRSTLGDQLDLAEAARGLLAIYVYPRTGRAGEPLPEGWMRFRQWIWEQAPITDDPNTTNPLTVRPTQASPLATLGRLLSAQSEVSEGREAVSSEECSHLASRRLMLAVPAMPSMKRAARFISCLRTGGQPSARLRSARRCARFARPSV